MQFMRVSWKILVGLKDLLVLLLLLLFFGGLFALMNASPNPAMVREGALLLKLDGVVSEQPAELDPFTALTSTSVPVQEIRQRDIIRALKIAESDTRVKAIVLDMDRFLGGGQASLAAIGDSLDAVKKAGKPVYAFATAYSDDSYLLAAHATQIWVDPLGGAMLAGPGGSQPYYKGRSTNWASRPISTASVLTKARSSLSCARTNRRNPRPQSKASMTKSGASGALT